MRYFWQLSSIAERYFDMYVIKLKQVIFARLTGYIYRKFNESLIIYTASLLYQRNHFAAWCIRKQLEKLAWKGKA